MTHGLTPRQNEALTFIAGYVAARGYSPTLDEIAAHLGLAAKSGAHRIVCALIERGALTMLPNRARSIQIVEEA
jgi:repressor LexA